MPFASNPNPFDKIPRNTVVNQELRLLGSFDSRLRKVSVGNRPPIESVKLLQCDGNISAAARRLGIHR